MYIVMELLLGESLHARLRRVGGLSLEHAARIVADVADVLAAAHEVPLIHRDLKPDNIFLEYDQAKERVKVVDFGLAFIVDEGDLGRLTREDLVSGTPLYLSPEQASAGDVHAPADIYSLGIMLYELIAGETPFSGAPAHLLAAHLYTPHPPLRTKRRDVPTKLERLVDAMLHKDPTRRPTAAQVAAELREFEPDMGRERSGSHRVARSARAIDDHSRAAKSAAANNTALLAVYGAMSEQLRTALATNGIVAMNVSEAVPATADVVLFLEPDLDLERIKAIGLPAVATASPDDLPRITALMRAGVREVVALPVDIDDVVRKVKRVWSKRPRASLGSAT
jgi:serine/threonine protein kinase